MLFSYQNNTSLLPDKGSGVFPGAVVRALWVNLLFLPESQYEAEQQRVVTAAVLLSAVLNSEASAGAGVAGA